MVAKIITPIQRIEIECNGNDTAKKVLIQNGVDVRDDSRWSLDGMILNGRDLHVRFSSFGIDDVVYIQQIA